MVLVAVRIHTVRQWSCGNGGCSGGSGCLANSGFHPVVHLGIEARSCTAFLLLELLSVQVSFVFETFKILELIVQLLHDGLGERCGGWASSI